MKKLEVQLSATAEKQLRAVPRVDQQRLVTAFRALATTPRPRGCRKLQGYDDVFRIRVGTYRVIYAVHHRQLIVIVLKIGQRQDVYR